MPPSLPRRSVETQYPHPLYIFVFESQTNGGSGKKKRMGAIPSVPSRLSVLLPSCLLHASRGQAWSPRARTKQSLPCRFSQRLVCVFLSLEQHGPISALWARRVLPSCLLYASRGQTWRPRASTNQSLPCRLSQSVVSVFINP